MGGRDGIAGHSRKFMRAISWRMDRSKSIVNDYLALLIGCPSRPSNRTGTGTRKFSNWLNAEPRWYWRLRLGGPR